MLTVRTHYDNLKIARNAPIEVIEAAYRALVQKHHPDRNSSADATRVMRIVNAAYYTLSDPVRRLLHDEWIRNAESEPATVLPWYAKIKPQWNAGTYAAGPVKQLRRLRSTVSRHGGSLSLGAIILGILVAQIIHQPSSQRTPLPENIKVESTLVEPVRNSPLQSASASIAEATPLSSTSVDADPTKWETAGPATPICEKQLPMPQTSLISTIYRRADTRDWPRLTIATSDSVGNVYLKVVDESDGQPVATLFIREGDSAGVPLLPGDYKIRYVPVTRWYGENLAKYCATGEATEGDDKIKLNTNTRQGGSELIHEVTIELQPQVDGNFATHDIPLSNF